MKNSVSLYVYASVITLCMAMPAALQAQWFDQGPVFTVAEENDTVVNTDRYYTQGAKFAYLWADNHVPNWITSISGAIPAFGYSVKATRVGTELGQDLYTPANLKTNIVLVNDRPYAGWLYTGLIIQRKGLTAGNRPVLENFQADIGIIGSDSLAENSQELVHYHTRAQTRENWKNQLKDEPGIALKYQRAWLFSPESIDGPRYFDFVPHVGFSLGNVDTSIGAGGMVRVGINLPDDFGRQTIHSYATTEGGYSPEYKNGRYGFYVYTAVDGKAVGYNAFLDGNLWQDSHHVTKEPLVGEFSGGAAFLFPRFELDASMVWRTHEFELQADRGGIYGALVLKFKL